MNTQYSKPLDLELINPDKDDFFQSKASKPLNSGVVIGLILFELAYLILTH